MSNWDAEYIISELLEILDTNGIFDSQSSDIVGPIISDLVLVGRKYDAKIHKSLGTIGIKYNVCYRCGKYSSEGLVDAGICFKCYKDIQPNRI